MFLRLCIGQESKQVTRSTWLLQASTRFRRINVSDSSASRKDGSRQSMLSSTCTNYLRKQNKNVINSLLNKMFLGFSKHLLTFVTPTIVGYQKSSLGLSQFESKKALVQPQVVYPGHRATWLRAHSRASLQYFHVLACVIENPRGYLMPLRHPGLALSHRSSHR